MSIAHLGWTQITATTAGVALLIWGAVAARRVARRLPAAVLCAAIAAMACTAYSGDTSWRFAADHLDIVSTPERAALFAAGELALFSVALMARQNLRTLGAPGTPGVLVWFITGVQVIPAFAESGWWGGIVRAFIGPILAALLWHLAMGIELRHREPGAESQALHAVIARELRERALSRLGLAVRDRTAEQITRDRATLRAVALAARLAELTPEQRAGRRGRRIARRLSVAVGRAQAGAHPEQRTMLLDLLAARRHATALATVTLPSPWDMTTQMTAPATAPVVTSAVIPPVTPAPQLAASQLPAWVTTQVATVPAGQPVRKVVTQLVTPPASQMTDAEIRRAARRLNRKALDDTGRPVTIDTLRNELGLSRRDATNLRKEIIGKGQQP